MADSDLALAMAMAEDSDSGRDDDFQLSTHAGQLQILQKISAPPKRRQKSQPLPGKPKSRRLSIEGKENREKGCRRIASIHTKLSFADSDLSQVRRPLASRKPNVQSTSSASSADPCISSDRHQKQKRENVVRISRKQTDRISAALLDRSSVTHPAAVASTGSCLPLRVRNPEGETLAASDSSIADSQRPCSTLPALEATCDRSHKQSACGFSDTEADKPAAHPSKFSIPEALTCTSMDLNAKDSFNDQQEMLERVQTTSSRSSPVVQSLFQSVRSKEEELLVENNTTFLSMDEVISLAEDDDMVVDVIQQDQRHLTPDCISSENVAATGHPSSANVNFDSQFNALLSLCVAGACESDEADNLHVDTLADNLAAEDGSYALEEVISSLMTQNECAEGVVSCGVNLQYDADDSVSECFPKGNTNLLPAVQNICLEAQSFSSEIKEDLGQDNSHSDGRLYGERSELLVESHIGRPLECPVCGDCIASLSVQQREIHTNACLDRMDTNIENTDAETSGMANETCKPDRANKPRSGQVDSTVDLMPVLRWLEMLNLSRYADIFVREEIDWDTLNYLTDEDLIRLGISAFGPRKKILHALQQMENARHKVPSASTNQGMAENVQQVEVNGSGEKLISEFFELPSHLHGKDAFGPQQGPPDKENSGVKGPSGQQKDHINKENKGGASGQMFRKRILTELAGISEWMSIPGTKFLVDAFQHLRADCSHWFLTHFHTDHYQGLTRAFRYGHVYCSSITAQLVHTRIGVPWERLKVLQLEQTIEIDGVKVTLIDANHCPGSVMILFEPQNGKTVLHTGDFRFSEVMVNNPLLRSFDIHTLILDTTYCNPQYDFPSQEVVIQFIIDAIQAEAFNPSTLFLIGTYNIGKEKIFFEVAKALQTKVYCCATKLRLLQCMNFPEEDMKWMTTNDADSNIHVVALWSIASFKRMKYVVRQNAGRFNSIVSFSPTGWSFGRGKKRTPGQRCRQGTIVRYEIPYSEHCSFKELRDFVRFINPVTIVPSVHNDSAQAADALIALLLNEEEDE